MPGRRGDHRPTLGLAGLGLQLELRRWRLAGRQARLWWRDDDARRLTPQLNRLLVLARLHDVPLVLAVIPTPAGDDLAKCFGMAEVEIVQHGVDHENRRSGPVAGEFPHDMPLADLTARLGAGAKALPPGALAIYVPPWNDVHPQLAQALSDCGYVGWSAWPGAGETRSGPPRIDAHVDLLRWRGGARFRGAGRFCKALRLALADRRRSRNWDAPIGVLTHHLDHDEDAWTFLDNFLAASKTEAAISWSPLSKLLPAA